jgi:aryl-alcohol dehydrogenase-like predicted oxidoreductase
MTDVVIPEAGDRTRLQGSEVSIPPLGVGTWAWGDKGTWGMGGYDSSYSEATIREAWDASIEAGIVLFDTAEIYGGGESERIIGRLLAAEPSVRQKVVIASKFMPSPWKLAVTSALVSAARASLERLGIESIDLYQIHGPVSLRSHSALADALAAAHAEGLIKAVGVSNYSVKETRAIGAALEKRGLRLASNQIEFSLLRTMPEKVGLLECCRELGVVPLAYSPIGQGRLTGKYTAGQPTPQDPHVRQPPDGLGGSDRRRPAADRRGARWAYPEPGGPGLDHRQGCRPHPRSEEQEAGRGQRRGAGLADRRRRVGPAGFCRALRYTGHFAALLAARLSDRATWPT